MRPCCRPLPSRTWERPITLVYAAKVDFFTWGRPLPPGKWERDNTTGEERRQVGERTENKTGKGNCPVLARCRCQQGAVNAQNTASSGSAPRTPFFPGRAEPHTARGTGGSSVPPGTARLRVEDPGRDTPSTQGAGTDHGRAHLLASINMSLQTSSDCTATRTKPCHMHRDA